jgi:hypothetical protein
VAPSAILRKNLAHMHGFFVHNRLYRKAKVRTVSTFATCTCMASRRRDPGCHTDTPQVHRMYISGLCLLPQALGEPFAYETYRQQRIEAKLDAQREGRISLVRKLPKASTSKDSKVLSTAGCLHRTRGAADWLGDRSWLGLGDMGPTAFSGQHFSHA